MEDWPKVECHVLPTQRNNTYKEDRKRKQVPQKYREIWNPEWDAHELTMLMVEGTIEKGPSSRYLNTRSLDFNDTQGQEMKL